MSSARISRVGSDWEAIDFPDSTAYSASPETPYSADSSSPPHHYRHGSEDYSRSQFYTPDVTPTSGGIPESLRILSPVSPASTRVLHPPSAAATVETYGFQTEPHQPRGSDGYSVPPAPPPPTLPLEYDEDYDTVRLTDHNRNAYEERHLVPGGSRRGVGRQPSTLNRISEKIIGTVKGRHSRSRSRLGRNVDPEMGNQMGPYAKVKERDEDEPLGYDISTFGAEFIPAPAVRAMEEHKMDAGFAYTETGEAIDLSTLGGAGGGVGQDEADTHSLRRAGTMENSDEQSYFFTPNREVPNWKPIAMRPWFISALLLCSLALICCVETLYQFSDRGLIRKDGKPGITSFMRVDHDLGIVTFAMWKYFPTLIAVIYGIFWKISDTEVKRTEPYYQLSKGAKGALAASTLNIEYQTFWSLLVPVAAIRHRQWLVVASSVASLLAFALVPILLSVFIEVSPSQRTRKQMKRPDSSIEKTIVVDKVFSRLLEATVAIILFLGLGMLVVLSRRKSGLLGDPSGIAGVAAMANKSHILMDFKGLDMASEETIHRQLNKRTYVLHRGVLWRAQFLKKSERDVKAPKAMNAHPLLLRPKGGLPFIGFLIVMCALLPPLAYGPLAIVVDKAPWVLTMISVLIKSLWEIVEKDMRMLEPFWVLFKRGADSSVLTLDYSATIPGFIILKAASKGHFLLAWVCVISLLVEVLTVVMGSLDGTGGEESHLSFRISFALAVGILLSTMSTMGLVLYLRSKPFLPRQPGTISSVLAFIHQSYMLLNFEGTEEKSTAERKKILKGLKRKYGFGWFKGRDEKIHLGIDHEELLSSYEFGKQYSDAVVHTVVDSWENY